MLASTVDTETTEQTFNNNDQVLIAQNKNLLNILSCSHSLLILITGCKHKINGKINR